MIMFRQRFALPSRSVLARARASGKPPRGRSVLARARASGKPPRGRSVLARARASGKPPRGRLAVCRIVAPQDVPGRGHQPKLSLAGCLLMLTQPDGRFPGRTYHLEGARYRY
jgi:hypothetical protein